MGGGGKGVRDVSFTRDYMDRAQNTPGERKGCNTIK